MREFKREKIQLESQVAELQKSSKYHDEHIRTIDAWLSQVRTVLFFFVFDIFANFGLSYWTRYAFSPATFKQSALKMLRP